jgi:hypothetical protein
MWESGERKQVLDGIRGKKVQNGATRRERQLSTYGEDVGK